MRRSHHRHEHPESEKQTTQAAFYVCGCGVEVSKYSKNAHRKSCALLPGYVAPLSVYASGMRTCALSTCNALFLPKAPTQRYHATKCKADDRKPLSEEAREAALLAPIATAEKALAQRCAEAGSAQLARATRAWNAWIECLGLPEDMKEAT
jgi:hypothetical protein